MPSQPKSKHETTTAPNKQKMFTMQQPNQNYTNPAFQFTGDASFLFANFQQPPYDQQDIINKLNFSGTPSTVSSAASPGEANLEQYPPYNDQPMGHHFDFVQALLADEGIKEYMNLETPQKIKLYCRYPKCKDRNQKFSSYISLAHHMNVHSKEINFKPKYTCDGVHQFASNCPFTVLGFAKESDIREHKQHRICKDCNRLFSRIDNLKTHTTSKGGKPSPCAKKAARKQATTKVTKSKALSGSVAPLVFPSNYKFASNNSKDNNSGHYSVSGSPNMVNQRRSNSLYQTQFTNGASKFGSEGYGNIIDVLNDENGTQKFIAQDSSCLQFNYSQAPPAVRHQSGNYSATLSPQLTHNNSINDDINANCNTQSGNQKHTRSLVSLSSPQNQQYFHSQFQQLSNIDFNGSLFMPDLLSETGSTATNNSQNMFSAGFSDTSDFSNFNLEYTSQVGTNPSVGSLQLHFQNKLDEPVQEIASVDFDIKDVNWRRL